MNLPVGSDNYGYMIYDWTDYCYNQLPQFQWKEVKGIGQRVIIGDDEIVWFELPSSFGFWRYYGTPYHFISICCNGWVAADTTRLCDFTNVQLPYTGAPFNIVAFLWDDLAPTRYGNIGTTLTLHTRESLLNSILSHISVYRTNGKQCRFRFMTQVILEQIMIIPSGFFPALLTITLR